jgi:16S rRNA (guanine966-N2)-methyltransferase
MRIIGGKLKGLTLAAVGQGDSAAHLRPTSDRVRESIFNLLLNGGYGNPVQGARVLDLFAGTGALGFESLSRGAESVTFVDDGRAARGLIRRNTELCRAADTTNHSHQNATRLATNPGQPFDLVFLDPPYGANMGEQALAAAMRGGWLAGDAIIVWEESSEKAAPPGLAKLDSRRYGDTWINILTYES